MPPESLAKKRTPGPPLDSQGLEPSVLNLPECEFCESEVKPAHALTLYTPWDCCTTSSPYPSGTFPGQDVWREALPNSFSSDQPNVHTVVFVQLSQKREASSVSGY